MNKQGNSTKPAPTKIIAAHYFATKTAPPFTFSFRSRSSLNKVQIVIIMPQSLQHENIIKWKVWYRTAARRLRFASVRCYITSCNDETQEVLYLQREEVIGRGLPFTKMLNLSVTAPKEYAGIFGSLSLIISTDLWCHYLRVTVLLQPVRTPVSEGKKNPANLSRKLEQLATKTLDRRKAKEAFLDAPSHRPALTDWLTDWQTYRLRLGQNVKRWDEDEIAAGFAPSALSRKAIGGNYLLGQFAGNCSLWPRRKSDPSVPFWADGLR